MKPLVIWTGPVNLTHVAGATLPDAHLRNIGCYGDRAPHCPSIADGMLDHDGRRVPRLISSQGLSDADVSDILFGAFSAGGSLVKRVLMHPSDRKRVAAVHLADATYTSSWEDAASRTPPPIEGFVRFGLDAIEGPHLLIATASPIPNKQWASGVDNLRRLRAEIEARSGRRFERLDHFFGIDPAPEAAYQLGNVILGEYPQRPLEHGHHAIAEQVWSRIIVPWMQAEKPPEPRPPNGTPPPLPPVPPATPSLDATGLVVLFIGAAAGYGAVAALSRWMS